MRTHACADTGERIEVPKAGEDFYFPPVPVQVMSSLDVYSSHHVVGQMEPEDFLDEDLDLRPDGQWHFFFCDCVVEELD